MPDVDNVRYEVLTIDQQELVDLVGLDHFKDIVRAYGGTTLYIPRLETLERHSRNELMKSDFDGGNYKQLAKKYHVSEVWVRKILAD